SGDVVLVLPGSYVGTANVTNKALSLVGIPDAGGARPKIETVAVKNLEAGQTVLVRGFASGATLTPAYQPLLILNCNRLVLVEDCALDLQHPLAGNGDGVCVVHDSSRAVLSRCTLTGAIGGSLLGQSSGTPGSPALSGSDSIVTVDACTLTGGRGADGLPYPFSFALAPSAPGGAGVSLTGTLSVRGSQITGGQGGEGGTAQGNPSCVHPSAGGDGVRVDGLLRRLDSTLAGGAPGAPLCNAAPPPGADVVLLGGSEVVLGGTVERLELSAVIEDGGSATLSAHGTPGDMVLVLPSPSRPGPGLHGPRGHLG